MEETVVASTLVRENGRLIRRMPPIQYPDNDREFIIDCPFHVTHVVPGKWNWELLPGDGCANIEVCPGYAPVICWESAGAGSEMTMLGAVEADLSGFSLLRVRVQAGKSDVVEVHAEIDGELVHVTGPEPGVDDYSEYTGGIRGTRLTSVHIRCKAGSVGGIANSVMWVMLVKPGEPTAPEIPDPEWKGLLCTDDVDVSCLVPTLGLVMDSAELESLRNLMQSSEWRPYWTNIVSRAEEMSGVVPEETVSPIIPRTSDRYGRPGLPPVEKMPDPKLLALAGLVNKRMDLMLLALRWALTWTLCKRWVFYGLECLGDFSISHGRFAQSYATETMALVLDWCGALLTTKGRDVLARAIHDLGVADIDGIMGPDSYVRGMNQGAVFESGRFMGATAVREWYPDEYPRRLEDARNMVTECLNSCIDEDGVGQEGTGYWFYTVDFAIPLLDAIAKGMERRIEDVTPACVKASGLWALANRRTDTDEWKMIPHADGGYERIVGGLVSAFIAGPLGLTELAESARQNGKSVPVRTLPLYLRFMRELRDGVGKESETTHTLSVFPKGGHVDVRQACPEEGMRIYFLSGPRRGHCHDDKNSFVLEAYGRLLLLDRGTPLYTHPAMKIVTRTPAHNTVAPDGITQTVSPNAGGAVLLRADEREEGVVVIESDAAGCWPGLAKKVFRRLIHYRPAVLVVEDDVEWVRPVVTEQYWNSHGEWRETEGGWVVGVDGVELCVSVSEPENVSVVVGEYSIDGHHRPVCRLVFQLSRAVSGRIKTVLRVRKEGEDWPEIL